MDCLFATEPLDDFTKVTQEMFNHLCGDGDKPAASNNRGIQAATQEIKQLIIDCSFNLDEVATVIETKSWNQEKVKLFLSVLQERRMDLLNALLTHANSSHGETLVNFNWVLKLVLGSSELKSLKYPVLQLMLQTESSHGKKEKKMYELNKETLNKLISVLENVE